MIQLILHSASSPTPTAPPTGVLLSPHRILNESALAAVELPNGDRRVFFQENNGSIRQAVYLESRQKWSAGLKDIVVSDAKIHTPLAAIAVTTTANDTRVDIFTRLALVQKQNTNSFYRFSCTTLPLITLFPLLFGSATSGGSLEVPVWDLL